jgi:hypothetical protein
MLRAVEGLQLVMRVAHLLLFDVAADFEVEFLERMDEEECRCLYDNLSRARQLPDGASRVRTLTRTL